MLKKGDRVGAIRRITGKSVDIVGYGKYMGKTASKDDFTKKTAKIKLDDGSTVYGTECIILSEKDVKDIENAYEKKLGEK